MYVLHIRVDGGADLRTVLTRESQIWLRSRMTWPGILRYIIPDVPLLIPQERTLLAQGG